MKIVFKFEILELANGFAKYILEGFPIDLIEINMSRDYKIEHKSLISLYCAEIRIKKEALAMDNFNELFWNKINRYYKEFDKNIWIEITNYDN